MERLTIRICTGAMLLVTSALLAACSSTPLDEAPVSPAPSVSSQPTANAPAAGSSSVAPVAAATASADVLGPEAIARTIYFDYDSSAIRPEFRSLLDSHARYLVKHKERKLNVAGHTDERGGREYNVALGQERADSVRRALQLLGVSEAQLEAVSFGEEKPASDAHEEGAWSKNRRAELGYR